MDISPFYCTLSVIGVGVFAGLLLISWITILIIVIYSRKYYHKAFVEEKAKVKLSRVTEDEKAEEEIELTVEVQAPEKTNLGPQCDVLNQHRPWIAKLLGIPNIKSIINQRDSLKYSLSEKEQLDLDKKQYLIDKENLEDEKEKLEKEAEKFNTHKEKYIKEEINKTKSIDISKQEYAKSIAYLRKTKESLEEEEKRLTESVRKLNNRKSQLATEVRTITKEKQRLSGVIGEVKKTKPQDVDRSWLHKPSDVNRNERSRELPSPTATKEEIRRQSWNTPDSRRQWHTESANIYKRQLSDMPLEANSTQNLTG